MLQSRDEYDFSGKVPSIGADLNSDLDYTRDWTEWLAGDTIATFTPIFSDGVKQGTNPSSNTTTGTTIWATPDLESPKAKAGGKVRITHRITTAAGREEDYSVELKLGEY